jgi:hypothetical protein
LCEVTTDRIGPLYQAVGEEAIVTGMPGCTVMSWARSPSTSLNQIGRATVPAGACTSTRTLLPRSTGKVNA